MARTRKGHFVSIRKIIPLLIFISGAVFGKPLALGAIGLVAKVYLYFENGWQFSYGAIDWHDGKLIFLKVAIEDPDASMKAKRIAVFYPSRHLEIERPVIEAKGIPRLRGEPSDWTIEVKEGTLVGERFGELHFSFERTWRHHLGRLVLEQGKSRMAVEAIREEEEIWVDADLHRFEADVLRHWIDLKGTVDGRIHLVFRGAECQRGSAHLNFQEGGYGKAIGKSEGMLDWKGEVGGNFFEKSLQTGRLRLQLKRADLFGSKGSIKGVKGNFSLTAGVGAKWGFEGGAVVKAESFPVEWTGKAFLHDSRPHWVESEAVCRGARISIRGSQEIDGFLWNGEGHSMDAAILTLFQSFASFADPRSDSVEFNQGRIDLVGSLLFGKEWSVSLKGEDLAIASMASSFACHLAEIQWTSEEKGRFQFSGFNGQMATEKGPSLKGEDWEGRGEIENGALTSSCFYGTLQESKMEVELLGTLGAFQLKVSGKEGEIALNGAIEEELVFGIEQGNFQGLTFRGSGRAGFDGGFSFQLDRFEGTIAPLLALLQTEEKWEGRIESVGSGFQAEGNFTSWDWFLQARGQFSNGIGFYCPFFEKTGEVFSFDFRIETPTWDLARLYGTSARGACDFDPKKTHFLGTPLQIGSCTYDLSGLAHAEIKARLAWKSLIAAVPLWFEKTRQWISLPLDGSFDVDFSYTREGSSLVSIGSADLTWNEEPLSCQISAVEENGTWRISSCWLNEWAARFRGIPEVASILENEGELQETCRLLSEQRNPFLQEGVLSCALSAEIQKDCTVLRFEEGKAVWKNGIQAHFFGYLDSSFQFEFQLPSLQIDLGQAEELAASFGIPFQEITGILEGKGIVSRRRLLEADFDFAPCDVSAAGIEWKSGSPIHLRYASDVGALCSGLDLEASTSGLPLLNCKIGLLQFELSRSFWIFNHSRFHLTERLFDLFPNRPSFLQGLDLGETIDFLADLECPSDLSSLSCSIKEVSFLFEEVPRRLQDFSFSFDERNAAARFLIDHQGYPVKVFLQAELGSVLSGRLVLEDGNRILDTDEMIGCELPNSKEPGFWRPDERPLSIDWIYSSEKGFLIREIEGEFGGVEASFHALDSGASLIGSARINFGQLSQIIPARIAQVFTDLKMGDGYELKGKLSIQNGLSFRGIFSGKQIELFGFQLRTLLSQFELDPGKVRLYDLKISDSAGMLKIDELLVSTVENNPWTISIPHLTILELRPSLLQKKGKEPQPAGPLVVREMRLDGFKGLLEESKTYTATGALSFINSFRREHTVFDIPSDLLGRIVGLDLELLIPACGILQYELKNGFFFLTSLSHSFSEANRSEFFLVPDPPSIMDLDGHLHILVSMKQFVIFKLTESFQILIDGKLNDPQFHLQKKRRFLGL